LIGVRIAPGPIESNADLFGGASSCDRLCMNNSTPPFEAA
jgi:hypothetical protein